MHTYMITTERLGLRRWIESDYEPFILMNKDPRVMKYYPKLLNDFETIKMIERINDHFEEKGFGLFAVEDRSTKKFIGYTGFARPNFESFFTPCIEIGWRYKKEVWGRGLATEAAKACLLYGFETLHFDRIVSFTAAINIRSEKVMKRIGMSKKGSFEHPMVDKNSKLSKHVLYEINKDE